VNALGLSVEEVAVTQPWRELDHEALEDGAVRRTAVGSFDAEVMRHLEQHITDERDLIDEYETLLTNSDHPPVRYLLGLLLEDEHRHHRILTEMLNQFDPSIYLAEQHPHVPWMTPKRDPETAKAIRRLRRAERADLRKLRALRRHLKFLRRHSLDGVLIDSLILDTHKHLRYLRTIQHLV
jgi:hypothetical protein